MTKQTKLTMDPIRSMWYTSKSQYFEEKEADLYMIRQLTGQNYIYINMAGFPQVKHTSLI